MTALPADRLGPMKRIGVLRANALGDFIFTLPALAALRAAFPSAELVLLGRAWHAAFLAGRGAVDRVLVVPESGPDPAAPWEDADRNEVATFLADARAERFDLVVQLHGGGRNSNRLVRRLGARLTIGLRTPDAERLDAWVPYVYYQSEPLRLLEVVALVGAAPLALSTSFPVLPSDEAEAALALGDRPWPDVVVHPGAIDPRRRWPVGRFAALADALAASGHVVGVTGSAAEAALAAEVVGRMRHPAFDLAGRTGLPALTAVLARALLVVSNDSGPLHLANAVGAPTVGVYWCGNLINGGPMTRTRHRPLVSWQTACPSCGRSARLERCEHDESWVADVPVSEALAAANDLLDSGRSRTDGAELVGSSA